MTTGRWRSARRARGLSPRRSPGDRKCAGSDGTAISLPRGAGGSCRLPDQLCEMGGIIGIVAKVFAMEQLQLVGNQGIVAQAQIGATIFSALIQANCHSCRT